MIIANRVGGTSPQTPGSTTPSPVVRQEPAPSLVWSWRSWTGQEWDLGRQSSPVVVLRGASGLGQAEPEHWWADSPTLDGSAHNGLRVPRGSVFLPLLVQGSDPADFLANHEEFIGSLDPRKVGYLRVTRPDGRWREATCRYESGADLAMDFDPVKMSHAVYGITWATADPYWAGERVSHRFEFEAAVPFFPGPPFTLGRGLTLASSSARNPGDVPAHPVWRVHGPYTGFEVGVGASTVALTLTRAAGEWVEIDMDPRKLTIVDESGVDRWDAATEAVFEPIPSGSQVDVTTSVTGAVAGAAVDLSFTPKYRRAW